MVLIQRTPIIRPMNPLELLGADVDCDFIGIVHPERDGCLTACWSAHGTLVLPKRLIQGPGSRHALTYDAIEKLLSDLQACLGVAIAEHKDVAIVVKSGVVAPQLMGEHVAVEPLLKSRASRIKDLKKNFNSVRFFRGAEDDESVIERRIQQYKDVVEDS